MCSQRACFPCLMLKTRAPCMPDVRLYHFHSIGACAQQLQSNGDYLMQGFWTMTHLSELLGVAEH